MPRRGYRKGVSDHKVPLGKRIHTRLPEALHRALIADAGARSLDAAKILRQLAAAHYTGARLELPHATAKADATRLLALDRLGNNLNQIAKQANLMRLHLLEADARRCIAAIHAAIDRL
jgi:hypothetical protein